MDARTSTRAGAAWWRSSTASTRGRDPAAAPSSSAHARAISSVPIVAPSEIVSSARTAPSVRTSHHRSCGSSSIRAACASSRAADVATSSEGSMPVNARTVCSTGAKVTPSPYGGHDPVIGSARSPRSFASSATRRDFPTPASATRTRTRREPDRSTSSKRSVRTSSSVRRPTNGTRSRSGSARSPRTCHTISGSLLPFTVAVGSASTSNRPRTARSVSSPITTASRGASDCIREVVFTTSPATASPT